MLLAAGVAVGGVALVARSVRWEVAGRSGVLDGAAGWAALPPAAWLAVVVAGALVRAGAPSADAAALARVEAVGRLVGPLRVLATAVTAVVTGVATARLVRVALDDTTVARITPTASAWVAPVALAIAAVAGGRLLGGWRRWGAVAGLVVAVVVGTLVGAWPPAVASGTLTDPSAREFRGGHAPPAFGVSHLAAVNDALYGEFQGAVQSVDERGRWFDLGPLDDARPDGYVGREREAQYDSIGQFDVVGMVGLGDQLVVATRRGGVFTASGPGPRRMLAAVPTDRTPEALATLAAANVPLLPPGAVVQGVGADGRGGLLVATSAGLFRLTAAGALEPVPGAEALLGDSGGRAPLEVVVHGRADGSILLALTCSVHELPASGGITVERARWQGDPCIGPWPLPVAVRPDGQLVLATSELRMASGDDVTGATTPAYATVAVDTAGRVVVADRGSGALVRSGARAA